MIIIKPGILSSFQSFPDPGQQWAGISPGGVSDIFSFTFLNYILDNQSDEPCIEFHFPGIQVLFEEDCIGCISGADFQPFLDDNPIKNLKAFRITKGQKLTFKSKINGNVGYFGIKGGFDIDFSNKYQKRISHGEKINPKFIITDFQELDISNRDFYKKTNVDVIRFVPENEYIYLEKEMVEILNNATFEISQDANRMGIRIFGPLLKLPVHKELISVSVTKGTIQLLPDGSLAILMADSQVTGGYPRLGFVAAVDLDVLAQKSPGQKLRLKPISITESRILIGERYDYFRKIKNILRIASRKKD